MKPCCSTCNLVLDPIPAKHHFLGRRHRQACLREKDFADSQHDNEQFTRALCWDCGSWWPSQQELRDHQEGLHHILQLMTLGIPLGRSIQHDADGGCDDDGPIRPALPTPSSNGSMIPPQPDDHASAAPAASLQPVAQPLMGDTVQQQAPALPDAAVVVRRCNVCDWAGSEHAACNHFKSDAHRHAATQPPATPNGRLACVACGIWCPNGRNLVRTHYPGVRHHCQTQWLAGPPPPVAGSRTNSGCAPVETLLPTTHSEQSPKRQRPVEDVQVRPAMRVCVASGPNMLAELEQLLLCPISHEVMTDPVCIADGSSYDRSSIQRWFMDHNTSPVTGLAVDTRVLLPNSTVRAVTALYHHRKESQSS